MLKNQQVEQTDRQEKSPTADQNIFSADTKVGLHRFSKYKSKEISKYYRHNWNN